jgi:hypothetical protein
LHPIMIDFSATSSVKGLELLLAHSVDGHFLGQAMGRWSNIHVETDSDNIFICSLAPSKTSHSRLGSRLSVQETVRAMAFHSHVNPLHRSFFMQAIRIHAKDLDDSWDTLEEETGRWAFEALEVGPRSSGARVFSEPTVSKSSVMKDKILRKFAKVARGLTK